MLGRLLALPPSDDDSGHEQEVVGERPQIENIHCVFGSQTGVHEVRATEYGTHTAPQQARKLHAAERRLEQSKNKKGGSRSNLLGCDNDVARCGVVNW